MKNIIFIFMSFCLTACDACESDSIQACAYACSRADNRHMEKYSKTDGCICGDKNGH